MNTIICTGTELREFADLIGLDPGRGSAQVELCLVLQVELTFSESLVRRVLHATPNLRDLCLSLPDPVPATLLSGLTLPNLELFSTNVPHSALGEFLDRHQTLTSLITEPCDAPVGQCGLCSPSRTLRFEELECLPTCYSPSTMPFVKRLNLFLPEDGRLMSTALRAVEAPSHVISFLSIEFHADNYGILTEIPRVAPNVRKLFLTEMPHASVCHLYYARHNAALTYFSRLAGAPSCAGCGTTGPAGRVPFAGCLSYRSSSSRPPRS